MSEKPHCVKCKGEIMIGAIDCMVDAAMAEHFVFENIKPGDFVCYDCFCGFDSDSDPQQSRHQYSGRA